MTKNAKRIFVYTLSFVLVLLLFGGGYAFWQYQSSKMPPQLNMGAKGPGTTPITNLVETNSYAPAKTFNLTAKVAKLNLGNGKTMDAWTYNGTSPGPELRVTQGDRMVVHLTNHLPAGVTIHWHGVNVPGAEDGIAGVTQNAVPPNGTYTYSFIASEPGTYWYHSHQDSSNEVGRGLYGVLVVDPKTPTVKFDRDYVVALHEWNTTGSTNEGMGSMNMSGMKNPSGRNPAAGSQSMGGMNMGTTDRNGSSMMPTKNQMSALTDMMSMYDVFTANGTSEGLHFDAKPGDLVRLRLVNAGNMTHLLTILGVTFQVISLDGHDLTNGNPIEKQLLPIGAGQRYDIRFQMPQRSSVKLVDADPSNDENKMISATFGQGQPSNVTGNPKEYAWFDFSKYGEKQKGKFTPESNFTKTYDMNLGAGMGYFEGKNQMVYTINGKVFPNIPTLQVKKGDTVKITFTNQSNFIHPMHLHGHTFQVLSRNGNPLAGSPIYLDTVNVLPGETYDVAFEADNPGLWMIHCHDLHHAAAGMDTMLTYKGISTPYSIGGKTGNQPE
ncbi:multicopper oxidase family protein [Fodinisporobacter ferrooxydans]|uniref:Multicopper oxidase family protein n=1 Tax=Fodinisporobacter ferrooxydans TaxID=2901836 RepID=A0ABY4CP73_9BACL|nr:multicopper oxidase family protein [Alicyclobacillaceae bacterium MYW30-H2]